MNTLSNDTSVLDRLDEELTRSSRYWMFISIVAAWAWAIYLTYYNSRILGLIITAVINKFLKYGHIKLGSFSFSVLSGKVMFRDVHLITEDYSVRMEYGFLIFRWWRPYVYKELTEDLSHMETRMSLFIDGFEFHVYNRTAVYARLEKLFGLRSEDETDDLSPDPDVSKKAKSIQEMHWRDLVPVTKIDISSGRVIFGNYLMPYSLLLKFEKADMVYTTKPASTVFDLFMHVVKCAMENVQLMLVPSPKYNGPVQDVPPRYMGDGFVILMSNDVDIYYYMDEPGIVQHELEQIQMADGEVLVKRTYPCVGVEFKCNKNTNFNYGPWVDRQREHIWKFFFPADYQPLVPTREAEPGEKRQYKTMEFKMTINANSTIDILFTKNAITQAIHIDAGKGSYIEVTIPWITEENGYTTKVKGQLMLVDATTSMSYRSLLECETLEFDVTAYYPKIWNAAQDWRCDLTACKASTYLIFDLKHFFADLVNDWSSKATPDLYSFVPYTWTISLLVKQFEVLTLANENNWVDTSSQHLENAHVAFCGEMFELCATFPFTDFLPVTVPVSLVIKGENVICSLYLPENNTIRHSVIAISQTVKIANQQGNNSGPPFRDYDKLWRNKTLKSDGWVDCWTTPYVFLTVLYIYYPMPVLTTQEDNLLHPSTSASVSSDYPQTSGFTDQPSCSTSYKDSNRNTDHTTFDPGVMEPDLIQVELEVAPSILVLYGSLLRNLIHLKENYLGEFQKATDFVSNPSKMKDTEASYVHIENPESDDSFDPRMYRPFAVTVSVTLHDLHAHLAKNCTSDGLPCPSVHIERLCFEMDKSFRETKLQVLLSPCVLLAKDSLSRSADQGHLKEGHLALSGVQVRGHAMFSMEGLPLDSETLEYGWLIEATIGELTGKLTTPQLQNIAEFLQTFIMMVENAENKLQTSVPFKTCQHMLSQDQCPESKVLPFLCPNSEEIKYEMIRLSVDFVSIFVVESGSALNFQIHPVKVAHCNLHGQNTRAGITGMIEKVEVKQYVSCVWACPNVDNWLEAGGISLGPVMLEAAMALPHPHLYQNQDKFLRYHDAKTKRLWFLWPESEMSHPPHASVIGKCGCLGGCAFFGKNKNGLTFFKLKRSRGEAGHGAVPHVSKDGGDPGFGQSLLHSGKLVFETSQLASKISPTKTTAVGGTTGTTGASGFAFTRGYMSELTSPEGTNDKELFGDDTTISPTDEFRPGSTASDTVTLLSGEKVREVRRYSKESILIKQSPQPSASSPKEVLRSSSKKGRKLRTQASLTKDRSKSHKKSSNSIHSESILPTDSADRPTKSRISSDPLAEKVYSKTSLNSEHYFTANESDSEDDTRSTLAWSYPGTPSPVSVFDDDEPAISTIKRMPPRKRSKGSSSIKSIDKKPISTSRSTKSSVGSSDDSTMSFQSAPTEKDSDLSDSDDDINTAEEEDTLDMVNLHSHMNQAITESPLLLSCYSQHLSHYCCQDWSSSAPQSAIYSSRTHGLNSVLSEYSLSSAGHSVYSAGATWTPQFVKVKEGFSVNVMKPRPNVKLSPSNIASDLFNVKATLDREHKQQKEAKTGDESSRDNISKTTAVVQLSGSLDVLVTPLLLESLQRYIEAVIPTLSKIHPSALIDGLHSQCLDRLKQQNKLKKGKGHDPEGKDKEESSLDNLESLKDVTPVKTSSLQALFTLPKINVCVLQASIVEEVIAFSNLGSVSDLTAASLLAVCIDGIKCQLLSNKHSCKVAIENKKEMLTRKTSSTPSSSAKAGTTSKGKGEVNPLEPDLEKPKEVTREENVGTLQISHIHIQLRRLLKFSNFSEHVLLTAIPEHSSRVLFTLEQDITSPLNTLPTYTGSQGSTTTDGVATAPHLAGSTQHQPSPRRKLIRTLSRDRDSDFSRSPDTSSHSHSIHASIGFIMCECGLEDVSVTAVRRLGYQETSEAQMEEKLSGLEQTVTELQEKARAKLELEDEGKKEAEGKSKTEEDAQNSKNNKEDESAASSSEGPVPLSSPSYRLTSASMDSSSPWDSDKSNMSSDDTLYESPTPPPEPLEGDASNGRLELKTIWFNFASPPHISIHKKMDFTRMDWNLLSTATPAIDAWLNPSDRLMNAVRRLVKAYSRRLCSVMACMMIEGLESSSIHVAYKSKFNRLTPLSKTLQEDPSNQLLTVLRKYIQKHGTDSLERAVAAETVPQLITVQKGILALMRQWKNVLYMPNLSQINFKTRRSIRPYNVSFALPNDDRMDPQSADENEDMMMDQCDVVDERIALLQAEGGSVPSINSKRQSVSTQGKTDAMDYVSAESHLSAARPRKLSSMLRQKKSSGISETALDRSTSNLAPPPVALGLNRIDSNASFTSLGESISSNEQLAAPTPPATPLRTVGPKQSILKNRLDKRYRQNEDLYQWMAKQQEDFPAQMDDDDSRYIRQNTADPNVGMFGSTWSQDDSRTDLNEDDFTMATSIMQLADAQILFKPVLQSLGLHVESVRPSAMMKKFGGHLLLQGHFNTFKILIAESEASPSAQYHVPSVSKGKGHGKRTFAKRHLESAAFQCETFDVNVSLKDVIKFSDGGRGSHKFPFAMHKLEAKPSTLQINLMVNCHAVRQNVDMALLRLAHQVLTMVGNVKDTRVELKQNRIEHQLGSSTWVQTHRKQESKDSTSSADTQHSDMSHHEHIFGSFRDILRLDKDKDTTQKQTTRHEGIASSPRMIPGTPAAIRPDLKWTPTPSPRLKHLPGEGKFKPLQTPTSPAGPAMTTPTMTTAASALGRKMTEDVEGKGRDRDPITSLDTPKGEGRSRPQELPFNQLKKPMHLRFAQDSKGEQQKESISDSSAAIMTPPQSFNLSDSVVLDLADTSSPALNEKTIIDEIEANTPQCWRHLYQLLELYATMPEPKTVARRQAVNKLPVIEEEEGGDQDCTKMKRDSRVSDYGIKLHTLIQNSKTSVLHGLRRESTSGPPTHIDSTNMFSSSTKDGITQKQHSPGESKVDLKAKEEEALGNDSSLARQSFIRTRFKQSIYVGESIPIIVFGICKVEKVIVNAELSGLKLEANITKVHATGTYKKKVKGFVHRVSSDSSFTAHVGHSMINLREGEPPDWQTVVTININKSQALLSSAARRGKDHNSLLTSVGLIEIDIPQHPVILHDMMARSTKRITATLQELRWPMQSTSRVHFASETNQNQSSMPTTGGVPGGPQQPSVPYERLPNTTTSKAPLAHTDSKPMLRHIHFKSVLQGITIGASILPSLKAQYKTDAITFTGVMGRKVYFTVMLPKHLLSFKSKVTAAVAFADTPIPSAASIELPQIQVRADYRVQKQQQQQQHQQQQECSGTMGSGSGEGPEIELTEGLELLEGDYLYAVGEVGMLEHSLTTDLLNHLIFVQKVFMKEINEIVQKVSGSGTVVNENANIINFDPSPRNSLLYSVSIRFKGIQVTATTPTSNAVRFETGAITLDLSNRYHLPMKEQMAKEETANEMSPSNQKMFIQAVVDLNLALGQLITNPVFEEAEPEFHTMAFFKTTIKIRNALQHEMIPNLSQDQEALLISLMRPIILAQPLAFDKAVLVWLNYKNAYEYWTEQRMALNKEVLRATRQVIDKLPQIAPTNTNPSISTLFLQLTVDDMGICVPLLSNTFQVIPAPGIQSPRVTEAEQGSALVLTVESTQISACSSGSLVSKGKFRGFCVRFADDFGSSWDDWKPWPTDDGAVMNQCKVPSGTYEVCSRTINKQDSSGNAKWILNVQWDMKGIDVHLDTDIGKRFTLLGSTLTMLAGQADDSYIGNNQQVRLSDDELDDDDKEDDEVTSPSSPDTQTNSREELPVKRRTSLASDILPEEIFADDFDPKERARKIEQEMNEQAKVVQELKECGASEATIETERKKLEDLQALLFRDFRRDFLEMLKRKGDRASLLKEKLGLSARPTGHYRSKSTGGHRYLRAPLGKHYSIDAGGPGPTRRQSEHFTRPSRVSFSGAQLNTYTPPHSPHIDPFEESGSEREDDEIIFSRKRSRSLEVITSSGSDSQAEVVDHVTTPQLRRPHKMRNSTDDSSGASPKDVGSKLSEQSIDFELDVKVFIDRGNCFLYPKEAKEEEVRKNAKQEKRGSGGEGSPPSKRKLKKETSFGSGLGNPRKLSGQPDTSVFFIPSVDVKVHYNSRTENLHDLSSTEESFFMATSAESTPMPSAPSTRFNNAARSPNPHPFVPEITVTCPTIREETPTASPRDSMLESDGVNFKKGGQLKRANLYAWFSLKALPEEMIISPPVLDFLEQALEPLPITSGGTTSSILKRDMVDTFVNNMDMDASQGSLGQQSMAFFPVDVVVHIKVDPSFIRFNCHPVSRVECLLQMPSLDLFFSTKKTDINESMLADTSFSPKSCQSTPARTRHPSGSANDSMGIGINTTPTANSTTNFYPGSSSGGLSVTGCMSDFSLYIFHPYGTGVQRRLATHGDQGAYRSPGLGSISENSTHSLLDIGRRDSLSLNVEFIRVNISRTRKLERSSELGDSPSKTEQQTRSNAVRFSAICDIGTASFKYDMRRLTEILSLPKAWYRRTLARRLFLGDENIHLNAGDDPDTPTSSSSSGLPTSGHPAPFPPSQNSMSHPSLNLLGLPSPLKKHHRRGSSGDKIRVQLSPEFKSEIATRRALHQPDQSGRDQSTRKKSRTLSSPDMQRHRTSVSSVGTTSLMSTSWETLVLFAVNLSQLNLEVNMANVMGNTEWCTKGVKSHGRLSINSSGHKNLNIEAGFDKSTFESKGGIVGGNIGVESLKAHFSVCEDPGLGQDPDHQAGLSTSLVETKLDYMGSSIIMTRLSDLSLLLKDEWHVDSNTQQDAPLATNRSAFLFVNGKLSWSHFHMMISRSTTPDLIKIISKLDEFFSQQVMSGRRAFQHAAPPYASASHHPRKISESAVLNELRHHRHWQGALQHLLGCHFSMLPSVLPKDGMVLGGTMTLQGQGLMLASFHGINFRARYWALFNIKDPFIYFATEAQRIPEGGTHIVQDLQFVVGQQGPNQSVGITSSSMQDAGVLNNMATICKVSRTQHMPSNFTSIDEWFTYALTSSVTDLDVVTNFGDRARDADGDGARKYSKAKAAYHSHDTEVIFSFPSMYMDLKTSHFQGDEPPQPNDDRPVVECSFVAEFYDHIFVAMDAEVILFLHDLVASYIKEKDKGAGSKSSSASAKTAKESKAEEKASLSDPTSALKHDFRAFECKTWQLEPTLRLIHWASTRIDPVGADYVLQKLGFSKARVTIPKWVQRGFMDPLDKVLSMLVDKLILALRDQQGYAEEASSTTAGAADLDTSIGPVGGSDKGIDRGDKV